MLMSVSDPRFVWGRYAAEAGPCWSCRNQSGVDDGGVPDRTKANTLKLLNEDNVFALFGYTGTHTINPILSLVEKSKVPFFAPASGDVATREPLNRYTYNIRASYFEETEKNCRAADATRID